MPTTLKITSINDYSLYLDALLKKHFKTEKAQKDFKELLLTSFLDGLKFSQNKLNITV